MYEQTTFIPVGHSPHGKCNLCGGLVTVPSMWGGIIPPTPVCQKCGATAKPVKPINPFDYLPEVDMVPPGKTQLNG